MSEALDKINSEVDDTFKIYASESERNGDIIDRTLGSSHFWTKSIMGDGLSFVAGAVLASGGVGAIFKGLNYLSKASGLTNVVTQGISKVGVGVESIAGGSERISKVANTLKGASQAFNGSQKMSSLGNAVA